MGTPNLYLLLKKFKLFGISGGGVAKNLGVSPRANELSGGTFTTWYIHYYPLADLRGARDAHPSGGPNSFNFMQVLEKFGKIICWPPLGGWRPQPRGNPWSPLLPVTVNKLLKKLHIINVFHWCLFTMYSTNLSVTSSIITRQFTGKARLIQTRFIRSFCEIFSYHFMFKMDG